MFGFERRTNGSGGNPQQSTFSQPVNNWYRVELTRCYENIDDLDDNITNAILYGDDKDLIGNHSGSDDTFNKFDRVVIRGGRPYYFDFIAVGNFVCQEPKISFEDTETDIPEIICQDITVELDQNGFIIFDAELAIAMKDDCNELTYSASEESFDCNDIGSNRVKILARDEHGNEAICISNVTVKDNIAPKISCPENISIEANLSDCSTQVTWTEPITKDNCTEELTIISTHESGDRFPLGITIVKYTATDDEGNSISCEFSVTVFSNTTTPLIELEEYSGLNDNDGIICQGDKFCLTANSGYTSYTWSSGETENPFCASDGGVYNVTVTNDIGCTAVSEDFTIKSNEAPLAGTCNLINDYCMENTGSVQLQASNGTAPYSVSWTPTINGTNSGSISNSGEFININNIPGGTTINFSVVDQNGCTTN